MKSSGQVRRVRKHIVASHHDTIPIRGDRRAGRIGLLGGSFNPAHEGHIQIALRALHLLGLNQVWLMVSPGNPLKPSQGMASLATRLASVEQLATDRRLIPTDIEASLGTRYAFDTIRALKRRFPRARFVWLMGTDVFAELPRWYRWQAFLRQVPLAVMPRPGSNAAALHGKIAGRLSHCRLPVGKIRQLPDKTPPVWAFLPGPQNGISATALRRAGHTESLFRTDRAATRQETRS
ncbi:nicotinate-nucleotide adenylyltransferase [Acetobacter sicerae]|uniref:nicotinate-nucleotide adenylyltransferase n=1 Tax=Acetobacter sicerae TaxID=85325 RepID=UPI00156AE7FC|nr:nicotinate-nucleotide adenylyltransferase [Acetobacter sicerae]NHN91483.1 nicotinate-nucleotide adenylyltransferase [Acetobacter sicerae]